jgi:Immunoglobulin I-set domain
MLHSYICVLYDNLTVLGTRFSMENGKGLIIQNITQLDDGEYTCRAEVNADGRYGEKKITVKVYS